LRSHRKTLMLSIGVLVLAFSLVVLPVEAFSFGYPGGYPDAASNNFGAGTTIGEPTPFCLGSTCNPSPLPRTMGGDGMSSASDSYSISDPTSTASASATAALGALTAQSTSTWTITNLPLCSPYCIASENVQAGSYAAFYQVFTVVSSSLPPGTPVSISIPWSVKGSFSYLTGGCNCAIEQDRILVAGLRSPSGVLFLPLTYQDASGYQTFYGSGSVGSPTVSDGGTADPTAAYSYVAGTPIEVGSCFVVWSYMQVSTSPDPYTTSTSLNASFSVSLGAVSNTAGADIYPDGCVSPTTLPPTTTTTTTAPATGVPQFIATSPIAAAAVSLALLATLQVVRAKRTTRGTVT